MAGCRQCSAHLPEGATSCETCGASVASSARVDPLLGKTLLNQYVIRRKLGQGGFGSVYEAEQPSMERKVAIKTLHPHLTSHPDIVARFRREGLAASRLTHPSAVKMYNFGETEDGILWMAMEFLEGETLDARIRKKGTLPPEELLEILGPVCEVLAEAHEKGVIHRDLKPDNIMLTPFPGKGVFPKVLDFGIAGILNSNDGATKTGTISGTPQYMSPEQWKGLKHVDHRSDIYALGIIAYQALSGRLPFEADTAPGWMTKHCLEEPLDLAQITQKNPVPLALAQAIMKALAKNPDQRYPSALAFKEALENACAMPSPLTAASLADIPSAPTLPLSTDAAPTPLPTASQTKSAAPTPPAPEPPRKERGFSFSLSLGKFRIAFGIALSLLLLVATRKLLFSPTQEPSASRAPTIAASPSQSAASGEIILARQIEDEEHKAIDATRGPAADISHLSDLPPGSDGSEEPPKASLSVASNEKAGGTRATSTNLPGRPEASIRGEEETATEAYGKNGLPPGIAAALKTCLGPAARKVLKTSAFSGDYTLSLSFSPEGKLVSAHVEGPTTAKALDECLLTRLGKLSNLLPNRGPRKDIVFHFSLPL